MSLINLIAIKAIIVGNFSQKGIIMCYTNKIRKLLMLFSFIFIITQTPQTVFAHDDSYTVVKDDSSIISSRDVNVIESEESSLSRYDVYLYVELSTEGECFQSTTDSLAYELYDEIFADNEHGIVIAYSFYDEFEGYYSIQLGSDTTLDENKMQEYIADGFNQYGTESEWITNTYKDIIKYVSSVEKSEIKEEEREQRLIERESKPRTFNPFFALGACIIILIIAAIAIVSHLRNKYVISLQQDTIDDKNQEIADKNRQIDDMNDGFIAVKDAISAMLELAKAEQESRERNYVPSMIEDKGPNKIALEFDQKFSFIVEKEPEASNYFQFENVLDEFKALSDDAKKEVTLDMNKVQSSYEISASKYARQIEDTILLKCSKYEDTPEYFKYLSNEIESCTKGHPAYVKELVFNHILDRVKKH